MRDPIVWDVIGPGGLGQEEAPISRSRTSGRIEVTRFLDFSMLMLIVSEQYHENGCLMVCGLRGHMKFNGR